MSGGRRVAEQETAGEKVEAAAVEARKADGMEDAREVRAKVASSDSAYGSSAVDTDTEDGHTPTAVTVPYNQDITHKVRNEPTVRIANFIPHDFKPAIYDCYQWVFE